MREVLFRAKRVDDGEWVEGSLIYGNKRNPNDSTKTIDCVYICWAFYDNIKYYAEVIPETVGEFAGLNDKNGKRIFEGDIVKKIGNRADESRIYEVIYQKSTTSFTFVWVKDRDMCYQSASYQPYEVIGNVHDNKELLEIEE